MTREEASSVLDDYDVNFDGHTAEEIAEAFDVAFRALEQEPKWIPIKTRKLTDAEEQDMLENSNYFYNYMFDCQLPEDGEEVLITTSTGEVTTTTFYDEGLDGCYFEFYEDDGDVIAWMPKPKSYKTESEVKDGNDD